jgi:hypothetical protein
MQIVLNVWYCVLNLGFFELQVQNPELRRYLIFHHRHRHQHARLVLMISSIPKTIKMTLTGNAVVFFYISIVRITDFTRVAVFSRGL